MFTLSCFTIIFLIGCALTFFAAAGFLMPLVVSAFTSCEVRKYVFFIKPKENLSRVAREMPSSELLSISSLPHTPLHALHAISLVPVLQDEGANMFEASHCHHLQVGIRLLDLCRPLCRWSPQLHLSCHGGGTSSFSYFFPIEPDSIRCLAHWLMPLRLH